MANARSLVEGDKGTVFVGSRLVDNVYAIINKDGKRSVKVIASGLLSSERPRLQERHALHRRTVEDLQDRQDRGQSGQPAKPTVIYDNLPKDEAHGWKFIGIGPDNKLYVPVGQPGNNVLHSDAHGQIRRMNLDGSGAEVIARGVRNTVGFDWHPETKQLYFTDNGRDWMSEDVPEDELNRITKVGEHFGAPYLPAGQYRRSRIRLGKILQRLHRTGRPAGPAFRSARHAVLHRQHVPEGLQERDHHRPARLVEPDRRRSAATSWWSG